jgi:hypothetical protein
MKQMRAKMQSPCDGCGHVIGVGQWIGLVGDSWFHLWCAKRLVAKSLREADSTREGCCIPGGH